MYCKLINIAGKNHIRKLRSNFFVRDGMNQTISTVRPVTTSLRWERLAD
jgi:hypothetical protein